MKSLNRQQKQTEIEKLVNEYEMILYSSQRLKNCIVLQWETGWIYIEYMSYNTPVRSSHVCILPALTLAHHDDANPYGYICLVKGFTEKNWKLYG